MNNKICKICKNCIFYFSDCDEPNCRRFPPSYNGRFSYSIFPIVMEIDFCGEFVEKSEKTEIINNE